MIAIANWTNNSKLAKDTYKCYVEVIKMNKKVAIVKLLEDCKSTRFGKIEKAGSVKELKLLNSNKFWWKNVSVKVISESEWLWLSFMIAN